MVDHSLKFYEKKVINVYIYYRIILGIIGLFLLRLVITSNKNYIKYIIGFIIYLCITIPIYIYFFKKEVDYLEKRDFALGYDIIIIIICYTILHMIINAISKKVVEKTGVLNNVFTVKKK
jgi:hypothetical protein